ncbi:hypothetical protein UlMin_033617 [Ulmus minor]
MASPSQVNHQTHGEQQIPVSLNDKISTNKMTNEEVVQRAQWLRAAILGANDGLLSTTSLMLGVSALKEDRWSVILSGLAGAVAGACSMAVGEFVSVSTQREIEKAQQKQDQDILEKPPLEEDSNPGKSPVMKVIVEEEGRERSEVVLPNPHKAAAASAMAFLSGSLVPLLSSMAVSENHTRIIVIVILTSVALAGFGAAGAHLGGSPVRASAARVMIGGWFAMAITYCLLKPFDRDHDQNTK